MKTCKEKRSKQERRTTKQIKSKSQEMKKFSTESRRKLNNYRKEYKNEDLKKTQEMKKFSTETVYSPRINPQNNTFPVRWYPLYASTQTEPEAMGDDGSEQRDPPKRSPKLWAMMGASRGNCNTYEPVSTQ
ncbi:hypothetical protein QE152_g38781 [Popillia japonica]|uniref:Uncharacterized protein n=1 Tax=Popillia japonica TaxID=7064 RepID=A0AAW1HWC9_POPJA